jgi:AcrR family transcriptional regulator
VTSTGALKGPTRRRAGRPRAQPNLAHDLEPREAILKVSTKLFAAHGYSGTTTRLIAEGVGLRQASLFHYFDHKEDILAELLDRTVRPALALSRWLEGEDLASEVALHALCWCDTHNLCSNPDNLAGLQLLREARDDRFSTFWENRQALLSAYGRYVGELVDPTDAALMTNLVFSLVEGVLIWFKRDGDLSVEFVANSIGRGALNIVGVPEENFRDIEVASAEALSRYSAVHEAT